MAKRYEYCDVTTIRGEVEERLQNLPACKGKHERPAEFWSRVERAGLLIEALELYDEIAAAWLEWKHTRRETKQEFDRRIRREGRRAEAERVRAELLASGDTQRQAQEKLVERFQPLDGTETRAWETPDPWEEGRLFKKKKDQQEVLKLTEGADDEEAEAENRLRWAKRRRDERRALADARRRAWVLKMEQEKHPRRAEKAARRKPSANGHRQKRTVSAGSKGDLVVI